MSDTGFTIETTGKNRWLFFDMGMDLTLASAVKFSMLNRADGAVKINAATAQIGNGTYVIDGVSTVLTPASGWAFYPWSGANDLDTPGNFEGEFTAVMPGGNDITPTYGRFPITITKAI